ncbi:uncharacterized protein [Mytilus edulis]|uniref:uncharacterized protein n=1 Tax=Mytilus edulis TaxID=6550 RepID=UPI0039EEE706
MKALVMNVNGNNHKPKGVDLKPGKKRREVAVNIIKSYRPDLILAQEGKKIFYNVVCKECNDGVTKYDYVYNEETGILYNAVHWKKEMPKSDLVILYDALVHLNIISRESELKARFHALILKSKGPDGDFLCVTYHGRYTGKSEDEKLEILKDFLVLLLNYLESKPDLPLILGGDFNVEINNATLQTLLQNGKTKQMFKSLSVSSTDTSTPNPSQYGSEDTKMRFGLGRFPLKPSNSDLYLVPYKPTGNRANIYDHFIVSTTVIVNEIQAVDVFQMIAQLFPDVLEEHYKVILDHDSIFVTFKVDFRQM